jgi:lipoprotein-anchoring transpeptidase ErfK/SrfK
MVPVNSLLKEISRREFLKLSGMGLLGLIFTPPKAFGDLAPGQQGRVCEGSVKVYDRPSFQGREIKTYWKDAVLPVTDITLGDKEPAFNRIWYFIGDEGYAHSGAIQPVQTQLNEPAPVLPPEGALAEVTVPFTDAHWGADDVFPVAYRFYYGTTHWVGSFKYDKAGNPWYLILDDKWKFRYYAPANHFRLVSADELSPLSPDVPPDNKRIEVRTAEQIVVAYEGEKAVFMTKAATGAKFSNGDFSTPAGRHITAHKRPFRHMAAGNLAANGYDLPGVPWVSYITPEGISFHGTYWHNNFGKPRSHGCINLSPQAAKWVYRWTLPVVPLNEQYAYDEHGTAVDVI